MVMIPPSVQMDQSTPFTDEDREELVQVGSRIYVPRWMKEEFQRRFGGWGAASFVFRTALESLLELTKDDPTLTEQVRAAMRKAMEERLGK